MSVPSPRRPRGDATNKQRVMVVIASKPKLESKKAGRKASTNHQIINKTPQEAE
jgi:hypothetical protein